MSTAIDERTDLELIEHLDWEHVPACEGKKGECPNAADYLIGHRCPGCGDADPEAVKYCCGPCWVGRSMAPARCRACEAIYSHGDCWHIIRLVRS